MSDTTVLTGTLRGLLLVDLSESIDLDKLHEILGSHPSRREPAFRRPAPEYVRFEHPPVVERFGTREVDSSGPAEVRIRYFDYGVASVELVRTFTATWPELIGQAHGWVASPELESSAVGLLREALHRTGAALQNPYKEWITEDYLVVQLDPIEQEGVILTADHLTSRCGSAIAQIVRGEALPLSTSEASEVLQSSMSYYPTDLLVLGWVAGFIYDTRAGAAPTVELLEYANTQLLEFRYYDDVLTDVLKEVYKRLEKRHSMWSRWRLARDAQSLNTIRLDYQELVERTENAIKFLGDMFYARAYRLAAARIGVTDYRDLVTEKLTTARDLYESLVNEFHQGRAFFLETAVVIILLIEIAFAIMGRR